MYIELKSYWDHDHKLTTKNLQYNTICNSNNMFTYLFCICYSLLFWNNFNLFYFPLKYKLVLTRLQYETLQKEHLHLDLNHYFIIISYKSLKLKI